MKRLITTLFFIALTAVNLSNANAAIRITQGFEGSGTPYIDETNNTLTFLSGSNSTHASFKSDANAWASSILFEDVNLEPDTEVFSFDYSFEYFLNPSIDKSQVEFLTADYFRVSFVLENVADLELFKHSFGVAEPVGSGESDLGDDTPNINSILPNWTIQSSTIPGLSHVDLFLPDSINGITLLGNVFDVYVEISNGFAFMGGNPLEYDDFNTTAVVDNIYFGPNQAAPVPEPTVYALFSFGMWFLVQRTRKKYTR